MAVKDINIDLEFLISLVECRPILWDKSLEDYKNQVAKEAAWTEIYQACNGDYDSLDDKKKKNYGKAVMKKWINARDSYMRGYKRVQRERRLGSGTKPKPYTYDKQMSFLKKVIKPGIPNKKDDSRATAPQEGDSFPHESHSFLHESNFFPLESYTADPHEGRYVVQSSYAEDSSDTNEYSIMEEGIIPEEGTSDVGHKKRSSDDTEMLDAKIMKLIEKRLENKVDEVDRNSQFFASISPLLKPFNDNETLRFYTGVLNLIRDIKSEGANSDAGHQK